MNTPRHFLRATMLLVVGCTVALLPFSAPAAETAAPAASLPDRKTTTPPSSPASPAARPPGASFWLAQFVAPTAFSNHGIRSYRHHTFISRKLHYKGAAETEVGYTVYLPPGYDASEARYPILYFLVGNSAHAGANWSVVRKAHELIAKGDVPPFIVVGLTGARSFYGNQFEGKCQVYDFFFEEFLPHIEKTYRTRTEARYRHIQGMSAGGNGAMIYALKRPDLFGTVTTIAGAFIGVRANAWAEMYDSKEENYRPFNPFALIEENQAQRGALRIAQWIGSADFSLGANEQFHRALTEKSIAHTYNDASSRPRLEGVPHNLESYYQVYGKEILEFHAESFRP